MSIEARTAFDRLLTEGEPQAAPPIPRENDEDAVIRQNHEALASWGALGVPVTT